jgi:hypothetical protein
MSTGPKLWWYFEQTRPWTKTLFFKLHTALKNISSPILPDYLDLDLITISYCVSRHNFTSCLQAIYPLLSISCRYHSNCLFYTIHLSLSSCVFLPQPTLPVSLTPSILLSLQTASSLLRLVYFLRMNTNEWESLLLIASAVMMVCIAGFLDKNLCRTLHSSWRGMHILY